MSLFETINEYTQDVFRNIPSVRPAQDLFDDLSHDQKNWEAANQLEIETHTAIEKNQLIQRGFEYSENLFIDYPFDNLTSSRFSDGSIPCWYASETLNTTIHETSYHFIQGIKNSIDAFSDEKVVRADRHVAKTTCTGLAIDLSTKIKAFPWLIDPINYTQCQDIGKKVATEGHPLLRVQSARHTEGVNIIAFKSHVLSNVRAHCFLNYELNLNNMKITVSRGQDTMIII